MMGYKTFFTGHTEIIHREAEEFPEAPVPSSVTEGDILDMVRRRPCTTADISDGLGIHMAEVIKLVEPMLEKSSVRIMPSDTKNYYIPGEKCRDLVGEENKDNG